MGLMLSLIGAIIMFLNPIYFKIKDGQSVYYSFSDSKGLIHKMGVTVLEQLPKYIFFNQYLILTIISLIIAGLLYRNERFRSQKIVIRVALIMSLFTVSFYKVMVYDQFNFESYQKVLFIDILNVLVCFIYFVSLIYFLIVIVNERYTCMIALGCLLSIALSVIPLLFVSPIGNRNFYYIYVLWLIILLCIIKQYKVTTSYVQFILRILACTVGTITIL